VRRIERTFEVRGMVESVKSYDAATGGNVLSDVLREYDAFGRPTKEYQEHAGAKDANSLYVENAYDAYATYGQRLASVRYPNGRKVHFDYSGTHDGNLNRLTAVKDDNGGSPGNSLAEYTYLGAGTPVIEDYVQPDVRLDYFGGTTGTYAGFDNFGRIVQQLWYDYGASANRDLFTYGYDRAGNRTFREHALASLKDEYYTYDTVNQLTVSQRGDLNVGKTAISGTPSREEVFTLDPTGNWTRYQRIFDGVIANILDQTRTHNNANEITSIAYVGTPVHDKAGNITTLPELGDDSLTLKYDAWNRLVQVTDGQTIVAKYEYDGDGRRIKKHIDSESPGSPNGIDRYEHLFYVGVQLVETRHTETLAAGPESLQPKYQWVYSPRYIDAPILRDENTDQDSLCDDSRLYYLTDANQNVTSLIDTSGAALERYVYDPYGRVTIFTADWSSNPQSPIPNPILYTGRHLDPETGLYYYRARYFSAELGRFVSRDPIFSCMNLYIYCMNNPIHATDSSGLFTEYYYRMVDGYEVRFKVAKGIWLPPWPSFLPGGKDSDTHSRGVWGDPSNRTRGSIVPFDNGVMSTITLIGGDVCNSITSSFSDHAGAIEVSVKGWTWFRCEDKHLRVLWHWEVTTFGNASGGTASIRGYHTPTFPGAHDQGDVSGVPGGTLLAAAQDWRIPGGTFFTPQPPGRFRLRRHPEKDSPTFRVTVLDCKTSRCI